MRSLWSYRAHKAPRPPCVCVCLYNNVLRRGVCTKQTLPAHALLAFTARTIYISKYQMEKHTMREGTRPLRLFISQYYCFCLSTTRHQVAVKFAFFVELTQFWPPKKAPFHCLLAEYYLKTSMEECSWLRFLLGCLYINRTRGGHGAYSPPESANTGN
jgi:hypothetical protein